MNKTVQVDHKKMIKYNNFNKNNLIIYIYIYKFKHRFKKRQEKLLTF